MWPTFNGLKLTGTREWQRSTVYYPVKRPCIANIKDLCLQCHRTVRSREYLSWSVCSSATYVKTLTSSLCNQLAINELKQIWKSPTTSGKLALSTYWRIFFVFTMSYPRRKPFASGLKFLAKHNGLKPIKFNMHPWTLRNLKTKNYQA